MTYPRVEIDLNDIDANGETLALLADADQELVPGRIVTAFEPEEGLAATAMVSRVVSERGVAFLWVNWQSLSKEQPLVTAIRKHQMQQRDTANARASNVDRRARTTGQRAQISITGVA